MFSFSFDSLFILSSTLTVCSKISCETVSASRLNTLSPKLATPTGGVSEWSSDPDVVIQRRVQLQRYLDVLAASGCPAATRLLAAFLSDGKESDNETETFCPKTLVRRSSLEKCRKVRGACALHAMTCGPNAFIERASIAVW